MAEPADPRGTGGPFGIRRNVSKRMNVSHYVVPKFFLILSGSFKINVIQIIAHLLKRRISNLRQAEFLLALSKRQPKPPPRLDPVFGAEQTAHLLRSVSGDERGFVDVVAAHGSRGLVKGPRRHPLPLGTGHSTVFSVCV